MLDIDDQSGSAPRLVETPRPVSIGQLGESLQLACIAQGSPRPTIRWFKQKGMLSPINAQAQALTQTSLQTKQLDSDLIGPKLNPSEWIEIQGTTTIGPNSAQNNVLLASDSSLLLIKSLTMADQNTRFRCLANNSYGQQTATTEIKLDPIQITKLVELEPKVDYISPISIGLLAQHKNKLVNNQANELTLNCTIRPYASQPLLSIEWLKNGKVLFSITNQQHLQANLNIFTNFYSLAASESNVSSLFDLSDEKLQNLLTSKVSSLESDYNSEIINNEQQLSDNTNNNNNIIEHYKQYLQRIASSTTNNNNLQRDSSLVLLYQLHITSLSKYDKGSYQCRARYLRSSQQSTSHLLLRDQAPQFIESFPSQLIARNSNHLSLFQRMIPNSSSNDQQQQQSISHQSSVSLKCIASGSPLPEISWSLSGFPIPESTRIRVGDYVTRDGLIVSFVNISQIQVEG